MLPNDATLHEFRALVLFAVGKYDLAAGPLYAVLSVGPGWDWTTMAGLYPSIDVYTAQLRKLEAFVTANPSSTAGRFVLAYHYLTQGHIDDAVAQLKAVVALAPQDTLSAQLVRQFSKPGTEPDTQAAAPPPTATAAPAKRGDLLGDWTARPTDDTTIRLNIADDGTFTWTVDAKGKTQRLAGKWSLADDMLTLAESGQGGRWSAASAGRPTTDGDSACSEPGPRTRGYRSLVKRRMSCCYASHRSFLLRASVQRRGRVSWVASGPQVARPDLNFS